MKIFLSLISIFILESTSSAKDFFDPKVAAQVTANFLNESKTLGGWLDSITTSLSPEEVTGVRKLFGTNEASLRTPLPIARSRGTVVSFANSQVQLEFNSDRSFRLNNKLFHPYPQGQFDIYLKKMISEVAPSQAILSLFLPQALAASEGELYRELFLIAGATAARAVAVGVVTIYVGKELYELYRDGDVKCQDNDFILRQKTRNMAGLASSKEFKLDLGKVRNLMGDGSVVCNPDSASQLHKYLNRDKDRGRFKKELQEDKGNAR